MKPWKEWREEVLMDNPGDDIIEQLLPDAPGEYILIGGRPGIGKTNILLHLLFCLATGTPFLGMKVKQCKVGYLAFEGSRRKLNGRLEKIALNFPDPGDNLMVEKASPYLLAKDKTGRRFVESLLGLKVIGIDPLRYFAPYSEVKESAAFIADLKGFLQSAGAMAIINHHLRKRDKRYRIYPENFIDEFKGATDFVDSAQSVLLLERGFQPRDEDGKLLKIAEDNRILYFVKAKDAQEDIEPMELKFNREKLMFEYS